MSPVDEIVAAARRLKPDQFVKLRRRLDRIEQRLWQQELARTSAELRAAKITDRDIDRLLTRRRREGRA
jgi:hypothetical protein